MVYYLLSATPSGTNKNTAAASFFSGAAGSVELPGRTARGLLAKRRG